MLKTNIRRFLPRRATVRALCLCVSLCAALCACSATPQNAPAATAAQSGANADSAGSAAESNPPAALRTLAADRTRDAQTYYGAATTRKGGRYGWRLDLQNGTMEKLCTVPGCAHTVDACDALVNPDAIRADTSILADDECLYWVSWCGGVSPSKPYIEVSGLRGENRRKIATFAETSAIRETPVVTDGKTLYLVNALASTDRTQHDTRLLVGVDIATGETRFTYELTGINPIFLGALGDKLLFSMVTLTDDCPEPPRYQSYNELANRETLLPYMQTVFYTLTTDGAQCETVYTHDGPYFEGLYQDGKLYAVDAAQRSLTETSLATGAAATLAEDLPEGMAVDSVWRDYILLSRARPRTDGTSDTRLFVLHRATGELRESPLRCMRKQEPSYPDVVCESESDFLIVSDETRGQKMLEGMGGELYTVDSMRYTYSLVSQQDFFDGKANYRTVTLLPDMEETLNG